MASLENASQKRQSSKIRNTYRGFSGRSKLDSDTIELDDAAAREDDDAEVVAKAANGSGSAVGGMVGDVADVVVVVVVDELDDTEVRVKVKLVVLISLRSSGSGENSGAMVRRWPSSNLGFLNSRAGDASEPISDSVGGVSN